MKAAVLDVKESSSKALRWIQILGAGKRPSLKSCRDGVKRARMAAKLCVRLQFRHGFLLTEMPDRRHSLLLFTSACLLSPSKVAVTK